MADKDHKFELEIYFKNMARANIFKRFRELEILFCLYEHKSLTEAQLQRVAAPHVKLSAFRNNIIEMAAEHLLHRKKENTTNRSYYYRLGNVGLDRIANELEVENIENINYNQPEDYYKNIQNWMTRFLYNDKWEGIYRPHCDARQFPFNNLIGEAAYRPDWIIINSNDKYSDMMFKEDFKSNPLFYPYQYRHLKKWNIDLTPLLMLECVTVTMSINDLREKWEKVKTNINYISYSA